MKRSTGIVLTEDKRSLLAARLKPFLDRTGASDLEAYFLHLARCATPGERASVLDALTTNTTAFYREAHHFDLLTRLMIPARRSELPARPLRVWSAACSSGEEPYTLALELERRCRLGELSDYRVLATDISSGALQEGRAGRYAKDRLRGLPREILERGFDPCRIGGRPGAQVKHELRRKVSFHQLNLVGEDWRMLHRFDVIFCRNVLIYFDESTRREVVRRLVDQLLPRGFLVLGHSDAGLARGVPLQPVGPTAYQRLEPETDGGERRR